MDRTNAMDRLGEYIYALHRQAELVIGLESVVFQFIMLCIQNFTTFYHSTLSVTTSMYLPNI